MSLSNSLGLLGRKVGMMRLFTDDGEAIPVTVVDVSDNRVTQVKTQENDGYVALQVTFGKRKASRVTKPEAGHLAKAGAEAGEITREFHVTEETAAKYAAGATLPVPICLLWAKKWTCKAPPSVKASLARSSVTTLVPNATLTVTAVRTAFLAPSVWHKTPVACSPASAWLAIWAM